MASKVEILSVEELEKMHTGTLMSRRESLLKCDESLELSDCDSMKILVSLNLKILLNGKQHTKI